MAAPIRPGTAAYTRLVREIAGGDIPRTKGLGMGTVQARQAGHRLREMEGRSGLDDDAVTPEGAEQPQADSVETTANVQQQEDAQMTAGNEQPTYDPSAPPPVQPGDTVPGGPANPAPEPAPAGDDDGSDDDDGADLGVASPREAVEPKRARGRPKKG